MSKLQNTTEPVKQFSETEASLALEKVPGLSAQDRSALQAELKNMYHPTTVGDRLDYDERNSFAEREILDQLRVNQPGIQQSVFQSFDAVLDPSQSNVSPLQDVRAVVLETGLQRNGTSVIPAHSSVVEQLLRQDNPNLADSQVLSIGSAQAGGTVEALKKLTELSEQIKAKGGKPLVVNMSIEVGAVIRLDADVDISGGSSFSISGLGYPPGTTPEMIAANPGELRRRLEAEATPGSAARIILDSADALKALADTGAKVQVAWGNQDGISLVGLLSQGHPNIEFVGSVDGDGGLSETMSPTTGKLAETKRIGNVIHVPESLRGSIDESSLDGSLIQYNARAGAESYALIGKDPAPYLATEQDVQSLSSRYQTTKALGDYYYARTTIADAQTAIKNDGTPDELSMSVVNTNRELYNQALREIGSSEQFGKDLAGDITRIFGNPELAKKLEQHLQAKLEALPGGREIKGSGDVERVEAELNASLGSKLFTREQIAALTGSDKPFGGIPSDTQRDDAIFVRVRSASSLMNRSGGIEVYTGVKTNQGTTVLGLQSEGTSWATPVRSGEILRGL
jgi:hypothetical protein